MKKLRGFLFALMCLLLPITAQGVFVWDIKSIDYFSVGTDHRKFKPVLLAVLVDIHGNILVPPSPFSGNVHSANNVYDYIIHHTIEPHLTNINREHWFLWFRLMRSLDEPSRYVMPVADHVIRLDHLLDVVNEESDYYLEIFMNHYWRHQIVSSQNGISIPLNIQQISQQIRHYGALAVDNLRFILQDNSAYTSSKTWKDQQALWYLAFYFSHLPYRQDFGPVRSDWSQIMTAYEASASPQFGLMFYTDRTAYYSHGNFQLDLAIEQSAAPTIHLPYGVFAGPQSPPPPVIVTRRGRANDPWLNYQPQSIPVNQNYQYYPGSLAGTGPYAQFSQNGSPVSLPNAVNYLRARGRRNIYCQTRNAAEALANAIFETGAIHHTHHPGGSPIHYAHFQSDSYPGCHIFYGPQLHTGSLPYGFESGSGSGGCSC